MKSIDEARLMEALAEILAELRALKTTKDLMSKPLLTQADLAAILQVDERTIRTWRHEGLLPEPFIVGRVLRWRTCDIQKWLATQ
jgi:hypothetical protein